MNTLLLNASYEPLSVIPWQRAVTLIWTEKADMVDFYEDRVIHSARSQHLWPAVVRLRSYVSWRGKVRFSRSNVYIRDSHICQYCGNPFRPQTLTFDHVLPRSRGGGTSWENIATACLPCNQRKGDRTPSEARMQLLRPPKKPRWFQRDLVNNLPPKWRPYLRAGS